MTSGGVPVTVQPNPPDAQLYPVQPLGQWPVPPGEPPNPVQPLGQWAVPPGGGPVTVRNIRPGDGAFAARVTVDGFRSKFEWSLGKNRIERLIEALTQANEQMTADYWRIYIAEYEGRPAGLVQLKFHGNRDAEPNVNFEDYIGCWGSCRLCCLEMAVGAGDVDPGHCYVDHICVDESFRGKGIGKALLQHADNEARSRGCHSIYLEVAQDNRAKNLYERQGYRITKDDDGCLITWCTTGIRRFYKMEKQL